MQHTQSMAVVQGKLQMLNSVGAVPTSALPQLCRVGIATRRGQGGLGYGTMALCFEQILPHPVVWMSIRAPSHLQHFLHLYVIFLPSRSLSSIQYHTLHLDDCSVYFMYYP